MKRLIIACELFFIILLGYLVLSQMTPSYASNAELVPTPTFMPPTPTPTPVRGIPTAITIPSLAINARIEQVGITDTGSMDIPTDPSLVAWYQFGYKPGDKGSVVLAGHYDDSTGAPAIFYNLQTLQPGAEITIQNSFGETFTYVVENIVSYPLDNVPVDEIFKANDTERLNLITCEGTWDWERGTYTNRTVVYTRLR